MLILFFVFWWSDDSIVSGRFLSDVSGMVHIKNPAENDAIPKNAVGIQFAISPWNFLIKKLLK